ncbi:uncharacterized protein LOC116347836 [Contarinia nasturtii]|uniref:uncharacterized protein LOC116347836 n=1 Tax=Contarinia nasturtii TaxID=265458 RepID=UPI0012D3E264|nr:uncharacterized protein LOC116347836 [Contarinia nasturtii]
MSVPSELSLAEIRNFMLINGGKVTNHELVKYFKKFLTQPDTKGEARKRFKTYVNILSTIKNENNEKYLILRKRYYNECPIENELNDDLNLLGHPELLQSPGSRSGISEHDLCASGRFSNEYQSKPQDPSPYKEPPPYKPPPKVLLYAYQNQEKYGECVNEFKSELYTIGSQRNNVDPEQIDMAPKLPPKIKPTKEVARCSKQDNLDHKTEKSVCTAINLCDVGNDDKENITKPFKIDHAERTIDKQISVKEATKKFNRIASEEEASKIISPNTKKRPEKQIDEVIGENLVNLTGHPKTKEWLVSSARCNYQELAKLSAEYPELVRLQDPTTGYTALHWAAKFGNEDVVKLIAGSHKAEVNSKTNGGYSPLHLAVLFGKDNIFELLCNVYKANRDVLDHCGRKPLDYISTNSNRKQSTKSVSASTFSKIKARKKHSEKDLSFLRIGSLNVRVKKTTEAFSNFLGVGNNSNLQYGSNTNDVNHRYLQARDTSCSSSFDIIHKTWGSADNIPPNKETKTMMPPKFNSVKKRRAKRSAEYLNSTTRIGHRSMPTTPNQTRSTTIHSVHEMTEQSSDSDTAGFDSNWK